MITTEIKRPNLALYYPGYQWHSLNWIKNMLLFFDGIAILMPKHPSGTETLDEDIAAYLESRKLLRVLDPDIVVDKVIAKKLADKVIGLIDSGALDTLLEDTGSQFSELTYSRLGGYADQEMADTIVRALKARGLAGGSKRNTSVSLHTVARSTILTLLSQLVASRGADLGLDLSPSTDSSLYAGALVNLLEVPGFPSHGNVVQFDLDTIGVDLEDVPLDELIDYRKEHKKEYSAYTRKVREYVRDLSLMTLEDRRSAYKDRIEDIEDLASKLRKAARQAWKKPAIFTLGIAGAAWKLYTGDPVGAVLAAGVSILGASKQQEIEGFDEAYTYIFGVRDLIGAKST